MRLSRPAMLGLLVLCVAVVLWLVLRTLGAPGSTTDPGATGGGAPTQDASAPAPSPDDDAPDGGTVLDGGGQDAAGPDDPWTDGPTGVDTRAWDGIDACRDEVLPPELEEVAADVEAGGPFAYPGKDGSTFGNFEGYLPDESRGYYREFTVETPGLDHRGARRIVTGGAQETGPEVWYFTDDHYEGFCQFAP